MFLDYEYNDGGRSNYFKGTTRDCVCRAIAIANDMDYKEVYDLLNSYAKQERASSKSKTSNARTGIRKTTTRKILKDLGWTWIPTMKIGSGCRVHLRKDELPTGTIIVSVSRHIVCVKNGIVNDTYDCTRDGDRCVYGYYIKE